jgi:hypothetical protein
MRAGAMRSLAAFVAHAEPDVLAVCEIDSGDAFALATRFMRQWAYRGAQALFWNEKMFKAHAVLDVYLPFAPTRPFARRGLLRVDGELAGAPASLYAAQFAADRAGALAELRFARAQARDNPLPLLFFTQGDATRAGIELFDVPEIARSRQDGLRVHARGFRCENPIEHSARHGIGAPLTLTIVRSIQ